MTVEQNSQGNHQNNDPVFPPPQTSAPINSGGKVAQSGISSETVAIVSTLIALLGSFLPWARVFFVTINGTDGDGIITAIFSSIALFLIYASKRAMSRQKTGQVQLGFAIACIALTAIVYIYDFVNLTSISDESSNEFIEVTVQPQIGIIIGTVGAIVATIACLLVWKKRRSAKPVIVDYQTKS